MKAETVAWLLRPKQPRHKNRPITRGVQTTLPHAEQYEIADLDGDEFVELVKRSDYESLETELSRAKAAIREWQPIESAPKDASYLLGWVESTIRFIQWGKTSHVPMYGWCLCDQGFEDFDLCDPTHWMPLPPGPPPAQ